MKPPFTFITYGYSTKIFTVETDGVQRVPTFTDIILATVFAREAKKKFECDLQAQTCHEMKYVIDIFRLIAMDEPTTVVVLNPEPEKVPQYVIDNGTVMGQEVPIDEFIDSLESSSPQNGENSESHS